MTVGCMLCLTMATGALCSMVITESIQILYDISMLLFLSRLRYELSLKSVVHFYNIILNFTMKFGFVRIYVCLYTSYVCACACVYKLVQENRLPYQ